MVPTVNRIVPGSEAERQSLEVGDVLVEINGHPAGTDYASQLAVLQPGDAIRLLVRGPRGAREVRWKIASRDEVEYQLKNVESITPQQKARRAAWLKGEAEGGARP